MTGVLMTGRLVRTTIDRIEMDYRENIVKNVLLNRPYGEKFLRPNPSL